MNVYNVNDFGAKGDGGSLNTEPIQDAIDTCSREGGGTVLLPGGTYRTGTIFLKDNVTLHLGPGVVVQASEKIEDYQEVDVTGLSDDSFSIFKKALIAAKDVKNIAVTGRGKVNGQAEHFPCGAEAYNFEDADMADSTETRERPVTLCFVNCENVSAAGISIENCPSFACTFICSTILNVDGIKIHNRTNQNGDGLHFHHCREAFVSNSKLLCSDDCLAVFGSGENITVTNCSLSTRWSAFRIGPFSRGKFRNISVSNCVIKDTYGCPIKIQLVEGGEMENISFDHIVMKDVTGPFSLRLAGWLGWAKERDKSFPTGKLRNIRFSNIRANVIENSRPEEHEVPPMEGEYLSCINLTGLEGHCIENVFFSNINITFHGGGTREHAAREIPELPDEYPEYHMFGTLPAYGLYARHVKGLVLNNVRFEVEHEDLRPAVVCEDVEDVELSAFSAQGNAGARSLIRLHNTRRAFVHGCRTLGEVVDFLRLEGEQTQNVSIGCNDIGTDGKAFVLSDGAGEDAAKVL